MRKRAYLKMTKRLKNIETSINFDAPFGKMVASCESSRLDFHIPCLIPFDAGSPTGRFKAHLRRQAGSAESVEDPKVGCSTQKLAFSSETMNSRMFEVNKIEDFSSFIFSMLSASPNHICGIHEALTSPQFSTKKSNREPQTSKANGEADI